MTRILDLTGPRAPKRFQLLWAALLSAGDGKGDRSPAVIRKEARLQDALEAISDNGGDPDTRTLREGTTSLTLGQEDYTLLVSYTEKTAWNPRVSRDVVDCWDWLSAAEKE